MPDTSYTFKKPVQSRLPDASGVARPVYTFAVEAGEGLSGVYEQAAGPLHFLTNTLLKESPQWLTAFVDSFLQSTKPYFAKPYSSSMILRHIAHKVVFDSSCTEEAEGVPCIYTPTAVVIVQGRFTLEWKVAQESIAIHIPDEDEEDEEVMLTATQKNLLGLTPPAPLAPLSVAPLIRPSNEIVAVVDTASLPFTSNTEVLDLRTNEHQAFYKRKVKEANLRAKLAQYKAERALAKYMDKYGDTMSTSSDESGWETSDADSGSDSDA